MYAVIETGGKQLKVEEGQTIFVEKLSVDEDSMYTFNKVLLVGAEKELKFGKPFVEGACLLYTSDAADDVIDV